MIIETTPERLRRSLAGLPGVDRLVRNGWVLVACWPPEGTLPEVYDRRQDRFISHAVESTILPEVACSTDWYAGSRESRPPALLRPYSRLPGALP